MPRSFLANDFNEPAVLCSWCRTCVDRMAALLPQPVGGVTRSVGSVKSVSLKYRASVHRKVTMVLLPCVCR